MEDIKKQKKLEIKTIINKIFNSIWFPIIIGILLFLKTFIFYQNTITVNETINKETIIGSVYFLLTTIVIVSSLPNKGRIIGSIVLDVLISTLLFFNNLYYTYSSSVLSIAQITNLQYGEEISNTLPMLFQISELIYWIDIVVIIILLVKKYISIETDKNLTLKKNVAKIIVCIILALGCIKVDNKYIEKAKEYPFNKDMQVKKSTIYGYHIADIENTLNIKKQAKYTNKCDLQKEYKELRDKYNEKYSESNYELQGTAKGKNVIILQLESIQNFVINTKINGKEITPNLNKFLNENIEFTNMYMQSYSSTADSEFSTVTSLYPMENGMSYSKYYTNSYEDIFKMFKNGGYTTSYMHGNYGYFWNRENVYKNLKVDNIELKNNFEDVSENIMLKSEPYYTDHYLSYVESITIQTRLINITLIICIMIATLLGVVLPKILFKDEVTIGRKITSLGVIQLNGEKSKPISLIIKSILSLFGFLISSIIIYILPPFYLNYDLMMMPFAKNTSFSFGLILIIIALIGIINAIPILFTHYKTSFLDMLFKTKVVDLTYLDEGDIDEKDEAMPL